MYIVYKLSMISVNATLVIELISFLLFLYLINRIMIRPLNKTINKREAFIEGLKQEAKDAEKEIENLSIEVKEQERNARKEALALKSEIESEANGKTTKLFAAVRQEISAKAMDAQKAIDEQIAEAKKSVVKESEALATSIIEKVLGRRINT